MTRVLVVDDDPGLTRALAITLRTRGYDVDSVADAPQGWPLPPPAPRTWSSSTWGCRTSTGSRSSADSAAGCARR